MFELSNKDLLSRLRSGEDNFNERKPFKDRKGWLTTAVALANSAPIDWPAILFVGANDDGTIDTTPDAPRTDSGLENLIKEVTGQIQRAYPAIYHLPMNVTDEAGNRCVAVLIPGSSQRPHFTGKSYVRIGPQSCEASETQFQVLIAERLSKTRAILQWKDQAVRVVTYPRHSSAAKAVRGIIRDCNAFYVTVEHETQTRSTELESYPLEEILLSFDHRSNCPMFRRSE